MRSRGRACARSEGFEEELLAGLAEDEEWNEVVDLRVLAQPLEAIGADPRHVVGGDLASELAPEGLEGTFDVRVQLGFVHDLSFDDYACGTHERGPFVIVRYVRGGDIVENYARASCEPLECVG